MININKDNIQKEVFESDKPVLIDFWAEWCGPCRSFLPTLNNVSEEMQEKIKVVKINIDENEELATEFNIRSIPTIMILKGNEIKAINVGALPKTVLVEWINKNI